MSGDFVIRNMGNGETYKLVVHTDNAVRAMFNVELDGLMITLKGNVGGDVAAHIAG